MNDLEVYLLHTANQWHEHSSMRLVAAFTTMEYLINYIDDLEEGEIEQLVELGQTQGRETNYVILTEKLNPVK